MKENDKLVNENPMLTQERLQKYSKMLTHREAMTVKSTMKKSLCGLLVTLLGASWMWFQYDYIQPNQLVAIMFICGFGALGLGFKIARNPLQAKYLIGPYALLEGVLLGIWSKYNDIMFPGIVLQAFLGTFIVFMIVAFISANDVIKLDNYMKKRIYTMVLAVVLLRIVNSFFSWLIGADNSLNNMINGNGLIGIGFSIFVIGLASFCLLADMDRIKEGAKKQYPKAIEWYCAFSLLVTVLWIYVEIIRLLIKLNSRRR